MAGGRPTDYEPRFCEELIDSCSRGYSIEAFAGAIGVCKKTLYNWFDEHPEFLHAKRIGIEASRHFWESIGIDNITNKTIVEKEGSVVRSITTNLNSSVWIFNMKNRFKDEWRDKQEIDHGAGDGKGLQITLNYARKGKE